MTPPKTSLQILGVDVGNTRYGISLVATNIDGFFCTSYPFTSYNEFKDRIEKYIKANRIDLIVVGKPNRFYNVVASHSRFIGVLCLIAEEYDIQVDLMNDSQARKTVFHKKTIKKSDVTPLLKSDYDIEDPDAGDAFVFAQARKLDFLRNL